MPRRIIITSILLLLVGNCLASTILETTGSARSLGMGGRSIVNTKNVTDWLANPAGLTETANNQIGTSYANMFLEDIGYTFLGGVIPLKAKNISLAAAYRQIKTDLDYDLTYSESATTIGIGFILPYNISLGVAINTIKVQSEFWGNGYSLDFGVIKNIKQGQFGLCIENIYSQLDYSTGLSTHLEPRCNLGIAYYPQNDTSLRLGIENFMYLSLGMEYALIETLKLRIGMNEKGFSGGAGLVLGPWILDYALFNNGLELEHRLATIFQL